VAAATAPKAPAPVTAKAAATQVASTRPAGPAKYTVQVGAFKSRNNAEAVLAQIQKSYPDGRIVATGTETAPVFRVISGAFATKNDADSRARMLAENGHTTFVRDIPQ
jgi:cell division protein FtsN